MATSHAIPINLDTPRHRLVTGCTLNALPCCCSCADKRPQAAAYPVYVDGKGIRMEGKRWQRYCRKCHDYWQSLASDSLSFNTTTASPISPLPTTVTTEMPPARRSRYGFADEPVHHSEPIQLPTPPNDFSTSQIPPGQSHHESSDPQQPSASRNQREQAYPLGTREDVQQDDYESPLAGMFGRAYGRYREAEEARQAARTSGAQRFFAIAQDGTYHDISSRFTSPTRNPLLDPAAIRSERQAQEEQARVQGEFNRLYNVRYGVRATGMIDPERRADGESEGNTDNTHDRSTGAVGFVPSSPPVLPVTNSNPRRMRNGFHRQFYTNPFDTSLRLPQENPFEEETIANPIDIQRTRPEPIESEDLKVDFGCKVCTEQKINTICMPCMHACMCRWCAAIHRDDCRDENGRWTNSLWKCPICRKQISEVKRFFI